MEKGLKLKKVKEEKEEQSTSVIDGLMFSHMVMLQNRMEAKTTNGRGSYLNKGQMVSVYKNPKTGKLLYVATDGRYCEIDE